MVTIGYSVRCSDGVWRFVCDEDMELAIAVRVGEAQLGVMVALLTHG